MFNLTDFSDSLKHQMAGFYDIISTPLPIPGDTIFFECEKIANEQKNELDPNASFFSLSKMRIRIQTRLIYKTPLSIFLLIGTIEFIRGCLGGIGAILTLGRVTSYNQAAATAFKQFERAVPKVYACVIRILNPDAAAPYSLQPKTASSYTSITEVYSPINEIDKSLLESKNVLERHVLTRVSAIFVGTSLITSRIVSFPLSCLNVGLSLLSFGRFPRLNLLAFTHLESAFVLIRTVFESFLLLLNPHAFSAPKS